MSVSKPRAGRPRSAGNEVGILELYLQCLAEEQSSTKLDWGELKLIFVEGLINDKPLFGPAPTMDETTRIVKKKDLKILRDCWEAAKYRRIVDLVQRQTTREARLFLLARWLCEEKVCKLRDIVEVRVLHQLAKQKFAFLSPRDFRHADRVRSWLPYFGRLLTDFRTLKGSSSELVRMGYDKAAVTAVRGKRSAIPAACEWLADRRDAVSNVGPLTLQNAYSRIYRPKRRSVHKPAKFH